MLHFGFTLPAAERSKQPARQRAQPEGSNAVTPKKQTKSARQTRSAYEARCAQLGLDAAAFEAVAIADLATGAITKPNKGDWYEWLTSLLLSVDTKKIDAADQCPMIACTEPRTGKGDHPELCAHHLTMKQAIDMGRANAECAFDASIGKVAFRDYATRQHAIAAHAQNVVDTAREFRLDAAGLELAVETFKDRVKVLRAAERVRTKAAKEARARLQAFTMLTGLERDALADALDQYVSNSEDVEDMREADQRKVRVASTLLDLLNAMHAQLAEGQV